MLALLSPLPLPNTPWLRSYRNKRATKKLIGLPEQSIPTPPTQTSSDPVISVLASMMTTQAPAHFTKTTVTSHTIRITIGRDDWSQTIGRFYEQTEPNPKGRSALMVMYNDTFFSEKTSPHIYHGNSAAARARMSIQLDGSEKWLQHVNELKGYDGKVVGLDFRKNPQTGRWKAVLTPSPSIRITSAVTSTAQSAWNAYLRPSQPSVPGSTSRLASRLEPPTRRAVSPNSFLASGAANRSKSAPPAMREPDLDVLERFNPFQNTRVMKAKARSQQNLRDQVENNFKSVRNLWGEPGAGRTASGSSNIW